MYVYIYNACVYVLATVTPLWYKGMLKMKPIEEKSDTRISPGIPLHNILLKMAVNH